MVWMFKAQASIGRTRFLQTNFWCPGSVDTEFVILEGGITGPSPYILDCIEHGYHLLGDIFGARNPKPS